jgi:hypothetical protein
MSRYLVMPSPAQLGTQMVTSGLVGHWDAGNSASYPGSGTTWTDLTGTRNATLINSPPFVNGSFEFDGTNQMAEAAHTSAFNVTSLTILVWVRSTPMTSANYSPLVSKHPLNSFNVNSRDYSLYTHNSTGATAVPNNLHFTSGPRGQWNYALPSSPPSGQWFQAGCWVDGTTRNSGAIFNGTKSGNVLTLSSALPQFTVPIQISRGDYSFWGNAPIAVVKLYNRVLSDNEITQNFNATRGRFGL